MQLSKTTRHRRLLACLSSVLLFSNALATAAPSTNVSVQPAPDWVRPVEWSPPPSRRTNETSEGTFYLLFERHQNAALQESFERTALLMQNEAGVQDSGNLSFRFDPSYQQLTIHRVQIHRDGQVLERLDKSRIRTIQQESALTAHILTGTQTALLFVEDLRVGDVLEYASSTRGSNPILSDHFSTRFLVQSSVPVERQRMRLVWPSRKPLHIRQHLTHLVPSKLTQGDVTDYIWDFTNLTPIPFEDFTPAGLDIYPYIELSDFESWARVVDWALPLYATPETKLPLELQKLVDDWQRTGSSDEERARLALQFIQDDLRYTGLELGPDSYRPAHPFETFERRFGDCKGKVALLCAVLKAMRIEAWPALVNTYLRDSVARRLPSPFVFNHVIVKLKLAGQTLWLDPTISHQGGPLNTRQLPHLTKALVVQEGVRGLEDIPRRPNISARQQVTSTFTIADYKSPVPFSVKTTFVGAGADNMRETLARADREEMAKDYLNFYARFYPGIRNERPLQFSDNRAQNVLTVTAHYSITNLWTLDETGQRWEAAFYAETLRDALTDPMTRLRTRPLWQWFPLHREQEVVVHLPDKGWNIPDRTEEVTHEGFWFRCRRKLSGSTVRFHYECETRSPEIPVEQVAGYLAKREQMKNLLGESLQRPAHASRGKMAELNWLMVVVAGFGVVAVVIGCIWFWRSTQVPIEMPPLLPQESKLSGLSGWLVLIGLGLCAAPFLRVAQLAPDWEGYFSLATWQMCAMPNGEHFHPLYGPLLIFEVLGNIALVGVNFLVIRLFFGKRRAFPKAFIVFVTANTAFLWLDYILGGLIPFVASALNDKTQKEIVRGTLSALLWSAYMMKSRRVRATFREPELAATSAQPPASPSLADPSIG